MMLFINSRLRLLHRLLHTGVRSVSQGLVLKSVVMMLALMTALPVFAETKLKLDETEITQIRDSLLSQRHCQSSGIIAGGD